MKSKKVFVIGMVAMAAMLITGCQSSSSLSSSMSSSSSQSSSSSSSSQSSQIQITISLNKQVMEITEGDEETLSVTTNSNKTVSWSTSAAAIATVSTAGKVTAVAAGEATITATVEGISATCLVTVTAKQVIPTAPVIAFDTGYEELTINSVNAMDDSILLEHVHATDYLGNSTDVRVTDKGGLTNAIGTYEVTYSSGTGDLISTSKRNVEVTYYGVSKTAIDNKQLSALNAWTYRDTANQTANEWSQYVVSDPFHSLNWNHFEGPYTELIMHGSDTEGHNATTAEVDDEDPNTMIWDKVHVNAEKPVIRVYASNNPYPDYNNQISKARVSVVDLSNYESQSFDYKEIQAPLNEAKDGLDYDKIRNNTYFDVDLSEYIGKDVVLFIEQDAPESTYQYQYFADIGYLDFQIASMINETRDTLCIYEMSFQAAKADFSNIPLDNSTSWGAENPDAGAWGLRNVDAATSKSVWQQFIVNGASGGINRFLAGGGSIQSIARENAYDGAGAWIADSYLANRIIVPSDQLVIYVGTDTDTVSVNYRLSIQTSDGLITSLAPKAYEDGYTPASDNWGTVKKSQWVYGVKLTYDLSSYVSQNVVLLLEQDENWDGVTESRGECTLWVNYIYFVMPTPVILDGLDVSSLQTSALSQWGLDSEDGGVWGLRGADAAAAKAEFTYQFVNGGTGSVNVYGTGGTLQAIGYEATNDSSAPLADVVLLNKIVISKNTLVINVGTDTDGVSVNYRLTLLVDGQYVALSPTAQPAGYTPIANKWGTVQKSQWVYGVELTYDVSAYNGKTAVVVIEQDDNWNGVDAHANVALWFNKLVLKD